MKTNDHSHVSKGSYDFFAERFSRLVYLLLPRCAAELKAGQQFKQVAKWPVTQALLRYSAVYPTSVMGPGPNRRDV